MGVTDAWYVAGSSAESGCIPFACAFVVAHTPTVVQSIAHLNVPAGHDQRVNEVLSGRWANGAEVRPRACDLATAYSNKSKQRSCACEQQPRTRQHVCKTKNEYDLELREIAIVKVRFFRALVFVRRQNVQREHLRLQFPSWKGVEVVQVVGRLDLFGVLLD